ncbi:MAG: TlpA disulfide reductase family protein [Gammaproteobacteria bacterium]
MKTKDKIIAGFTVVVLALLAYLWFAPGGVQPVPAISLKTLDGRSVNLQALRGQPVLITFWATSCPGCIKEMPHLAELYNEFHHKGLEVFGIAMPYDRPDHVVEMVRRRALPYDIAIDIEGKAVAAFGNVQLTPTSFLIDPRGQIVMHKIGEMDMQRLHRQIEDMLNSKQAS